MEKETLAPVVQQAKCTSCMENRFTNHCEKKAIFLLHTSSCIMLAVFSCSAPSTTLQNVKLPNYNSGWYANSVWLCSLGHPQQYNSTVVPFNSTAEAQVISGLTYVPLFQLTEGAHWIMQFSCRTAEMHSNRNPHGIYFHTTISGCQEQLFAVDRPEKAGGRSRPTSPQEQKGGAISTHSLLLLQNLHLLLMWVPGRLTALWSNIFGRSVGCSRKGEKGTFCSTERSALHEFRSFVWLQSIISILPVLCPPPPPHTHTHNQDSPCNPSNLSGII